MGLHIEDCAPAILFRRARASDDSAACIHRSHSDLLRHEPAMRRLRLMLAGIAVWPSYVAGAMASATWRNGAVIRQQTRKSIARQLAEQCALAIAYGIPPRWYYAFELYEDGNRRRAGEYLQRGETKRGVYLIFKRAAAKR